jgi:two-component system response regulator TctD
MKLLLVEAEPRLANWLARALGNAGYAVDLVNTARRALSCLATESYDIAIVDASLPDLDGLEALRRARRDGVSLPVAVLCPQGDPDLRIRSLELGADDCVAKPVDFAELDARLRALLRRVSNHAHPQVSLGPLSYDTTARALFLNDEQLSLPPKEHSVLEMLMRNHGRPVRKEVMHQRAYGFDSYTSPNAIEVYIHRLRRRLAGAGIAIVTMRGFGYGIKYVK